MITRMIRISPTDTAALRKAGRRLKGRAGPLLAETKHIPQPRATDAHASLRFQLQRRRIDAVAKAGRARAVIEDVAEMACAFRAQHLGADHAVAHIRLLVDMALDGRLGKA